MGTVFRYALRRCRRVAAAVFPVLDGVLAGRGAELVVEVGLPGKAAFPCDGGDTPVCGVEL